MFKFLRCDKQILLYNECLEEEPMYIPRKSRNDKVYTMNEQEKNIYNKLALEKLEQNILDTINKEIKQFLDNKTIPEILRREVLSEWGKEYQKDINHLQDIWKKEKEGTKKAFEKDK